jgi:hypothetical protein
MHTNELAVSNPGQRVAEAGLHGLVDAFSRLSQVVPERTSPFTNFLHDGNHEAFPVGEVVAQGRFRRLCRNGELAQ